MSAWTVPTTPVQQYSDFSTIFYNAGSALIVDASDPNTTIPDASRVQLIPQRGRDIVATVILASDLACTVEGWWFSQAMSMGGVQRWIKAFAAQTLPGAYASVSVSASIPRFVPFFARLVTNTGSATRLGVMFQ